MILSRTIVFIIAAICGIMALNPPETLVQIVQDVAYTGLAQLAPAFLLGMYWKGCTKTGAACGMSAGIAILFWNKNHECSASGWPGFMWDFSPISC
ncbi:MAG: sodium:solute symporter family transporter [Enterocloster clostridioformis]